jgi:hypothetical protein
MQATRKQTVISAWKRVLGKLGYYLLLGKMATFFLNDTQLQ